MRGTHSGEFMGIPASGKTVEVPLADFFRVNDEGRVAEHWGVIDNLVMMQQLGVIPEEPPPG
jgi:predicted ester cyclase